jgi:hypothetical protein
MAETTSQETYSPTGFLTEADEMSLSQSRDKQTGDSVPDTLEVHGDALTLLQEQIEPWRRPAQLTLAALAFGFFLLIGVGLLTRKRRN